MCPHLELPSEMPSGGQITGKSRITRLLVTLALNVDAVFRIGSPGSRAFSIPSRLVNTDG